MAYGEFLCLVTLYAAWIDPPPCAVFDFGIVPGGLGARGGRVKAPFFGFFFPHVGEVESRFGGMKQRVRCRRIALYLKCYGPAAVSPLMAVLYLLAR